MPLTPPWGGGFATGSRRRNCSVTTGEGPSHDRTLCQALGCDARPASVLTLLTSLTLGVVELAGGRRLLFVVASLIYPVGVQVPTAVVNIPRNLETRIGAQTDVVDEIIGPGRAPLLHNCEVTASAL